MARYFIQSSKSVLLRKTLLIQTMAVILIIKFETDVTRGKTVTVNNKAATTQEEKQSQLTIKLRRHKRKNSHS